MTRTVYFGWICSILPLYRTSKKGHNVIRSSHLIHFYLTNWKFLICSCFNIFQKMQFGQRKRRFTVLDLDYLPSSLKCFLRFRELILFLQFLSPKCYVSGLLNPWLVGRMHGRHQPKQSSRLNPTLVCLINVLHTLFNFGPTSTLHDLIFPVYMKLNFKLFFKASEFISIFFV